MAGLPDLIERSQPAYFGGGVNGAATAGADWSWTFVDVVDNAGDPITLTGGSSACKIERDGSLVATLTFTGGVGEFTVSMDEADTAAISPGSYSWSMVLDDNTSRVTVWGPSNSSFAVRVGVAS